MAKIRRGKFWYCSLEMKETFGMRPLATASWWMFMVDSGRLLLFPDGSWMAHSILKIEGKFGAREGFDICPHPFSPLPICTSRGI